MIFFEKDRRLVHLGNASFLLSTVQGVTNGERRRDYGVWEDDGGVGLVGNQLVGSPHLLKAKEKGGDNRIFVVKVAVNGVTTMLAMSAASMAR